MEPEIEGETSTPAADVVDTVDTVESAATPDPGQPADPVQASEPQRMATMSDLDRLAADLDGIDSTLAQLDAG